MNYQMVPILNVFITIMERIFIQMGQLDTTVKSIKFNVGEIKHLV